VLSVWFKQSPFFVFWLVVFFVTAAIALTVQLFIIPDLFPDLHAGHGLLVGGDWVNFHQMAVELAEKIQEHGWSAWELRPHGHPAAGIAAAIYAISVPEPYMFIPLNAALHATAGVVLMRLAKFLIDDDFLALCASLPFLIFPSAMAWYTQIHKDGFYFTGAFLCLYGWILLARIQTWQSGWQTIMSGIVWISVGLTLMVVVRTYSFQVMQAMGFILAIGISILFIARGRTKKLPWQTCTFAIVIMFLVPFSLKLAPIDPKLNKKVKTQVSISESKVACEAVWDSHLLIDGGVKNCWRANSWLPNRIEDKFLWLAWQRESYLLHSDAGSLIDRGDVLLSVSDFVGYFPRATQIGFLAPFPRHWIEQGVSQGGTIMRRAAGLEMIGVYCTLLFLPYALWNWRGKVEMWLPVVFGTIMVLIYTYSTPNLGTFYRQSYGFRMLIVVIGLAGCLNIVKSLIHRQAEK